MNTHFDTQRSITLVMIAFIWMLGGCKSSSSLANQSTHNSLPMYTDGLLLYYSFDGNANDKTGHGNNGTVLGATLTQDRFGLVNSAYSFDGTSSFIHVQNSDSLKFTDAISMCAWIFSKQIENYPGVISKGNVGNYDESFALYLSPVNKIGFLLNQDGTQAGRYLLESDFAVPLNTWTHVACTYDGFTMCLYVNGRRIAYYPFQGTIFTTSDDILIGKSDRHFSTTPPTFFDGSIDDVYIFNRILSSNEILGLYNTTSKAN
jgi:hypothetical protein